VPRFQIEIPEQTWRYLIEDGPKERRSARDHAAWLLEQTVARRARLHKTRERKPVTAGAKSGA
jgi:hypothetical protein